MIQESEAVMTPRNAGIARGQCRSELAAGERLPPATSGPWADDMINGW